MQMEGSEAERMVRLEALCAKQKNDLIIKEAIDLLRETELGGYSVMDSENLKVKYSIMIHNQPHKFPRKKWNALEKQILVHLVLSIAAAQSVPPSALSEHHWQQIAQFLYWNPEQCRLKWLANLNAKDNLPWRKDEDDLLTSIVRAEKEDFKWAAVAQKFNALSRFNRECFRSSKHCRQRWTNHLDQQVIKGNWSDEENIKILELIEEFGKKWFKIASLMPTRRTENAVKNRYNALIKQERHQNTRDEEHELRRELIRRLKGCSEEKIEGFQNLSILSNDAHCDYKKEVQFYSKKTGLDDESTPLDDDMHIFKRVPAKPVPSKNINVQPYSKDSVFHINRTDTEKKATFKIVKGISDHDHEGRMQQVWVDFETKEMYVPQREVRSQASPYQHCVVMGSPLLILSPLQNMPHYPPRMF